MFIVHQLKSNRRKVKPMHPYADVSKTYTYVYTYREQDTWMPSLEEVGWCVEDVLWLANLPTHPSVLNSHIHRYEQADKTATRLKEFEYTTASGIIKK